jgi:hypothetical protein
MFIIFIAKVDTLITVILPKLHFGLSRVFWHEVFISKMLYAFFVSYLHALCSIRHILLNRITQTMLQADESLHVCVIFPITEMDIWITFPFSAFSQIPYCTGRQDKIKVHLKYQDARVRTGFTWFGKGTTGGILWRRQWASRFHEMLRISWADQKLLAS